MGIKGYSIVIRSVYLSVSMLKSKITHWFGVIFSHKVGLIMARSSSKMVWIQICIAYQEKIQLFFSTTCGRGFVHSQVLLI